MSLEFPETVFCKWNPSPSYNIRLPLIIFECVYVFQDCHTTTMSSSPRSSSSSRYLPRSQQERSLRKPSVSIHYRHMGYRWKGPFNTYNFCMTHFLLNPIFTRVKAKIKNLLKRNLPTPVGYAERICLC